jgi:hypothetical protein
MTKRRKPGDWVRLSPNAGFVGASNRLLAEIQPEDDPEPCCLCNDPECREWSTLWTEPDPENGGQQWVLCHVSECEMCDTTDEAEHDKARG